MKIIKVIGLLLMVTNGLAFSATYYVPDNYPSIQTAINNAPDGSQIIVRNTGIYYEDLRFSNNKSLTIAGQNFPTIQCPETGISVNNSQSRSITFNGFNLLSILPGVFVSLPSTNRSVITFGNCNFLTGGSGSHLAAIKTNYSTNWNVTLSYCTFTGFVYDVLSSGPNSNQIYITHCNIGHDLYGYYAAEQNTGIGNSWIEYTYFNNYYGVYGDKRIDLTLNYGTFNTSTVGISFSTSCKGRITVNNCSFTQDQFHAIGPIPSTVSWSGSGNKFSQ